MTPAILKKLDEMKPMEFELFHSGLSGHWSVRKTFAPISQDAIYVPVVEAPYAERLKKALKIAVEAIGTLSVAVNDKVDDPGATAFCNRTLSQIAKTLGVEL